VHNYAPRLSVAPSEVMTQGEIQKRPALLHQTSAEDLEVCPRIGPHSSSRAEHWKSLLAGNVLHSHHHAQLMM